MTAFNRNDIPASVDTLEKLEVWVSSVLNFLNPTATAIEGTSSQDATTIRVCQFSPFYIAAVNSDQHWRVINRNSIRLNSSWQTGTAKLWTHAVEISTTAIPADFKA